MFPLVTSTKTLTELPLFFISFSIFWTFSLKTYLLFLKNPPQLKEEGEARELIRQVQQNRKDQGLTLADKTEIIVLSWPSAFEKMILSSTASVSIKKGDIFKVLKVNENIK